MTGSVEKGDAKFVCETGKFPCSINTALGGSTVCVTDTSDCPITDMLVSSDGTIPASQYSNKLNMGADSNGDDFYFYY